MKLRHLKVERFRGIKTLSWFVGSDFVCLVGPGDCCKSTVLDAIELVLSPRWNPTFDDGDFHNGDASQGLLIEATLGELPRPLLSDGHFGLRLRGFSPAGPTIHDEPQEGDEEVLTVRLTVDSSLEPTWHVVTDRHPEGATISARERERLGVVRLGAVVERHLSWSRGSVLSRLTGDVDEHAQLLADAGRQARSTVDPSKLPKLTAAATRAASLSASFGVSPRSQFEPRIDAGDAYLGAGSLALHDGPVPVRRAGLGTRRLVTLSMQRHVAEQGGVVLIDEVEHGLEPYRLRRLLVELLDPASSGTPVPGAASVPRAGSAILTTHSPITIGQLRTEQLRIVRTDASGTVILSPSPDVQGTLIKHAEAFLSRRVIVCEGRTELGLLSGLDSAWAATLKPFAVHGVALADAGGAKNVGRLALDFQGLRYPSAILADSDETLDRTPAELAAAGVLVLQWAGQVATEQRIFLDLPWDGVAAIVELALGQNVPVRENLATALGRSTQSLPVEVRTWTTMLAEADLRAGLGLAAKRSGWFKSVRLGRELGVIVAQHLNAIPMSDLTQKLGTLVAWIKT